MRFDKFIPSEKLKPYIKFMAISENTDEHTYKIFPSTGLVIGFQYKGQLSSIANNIESTLSLAGITGIADTVKIFRNTAGTGTILVYFTETGLAHFSACPSHELFNQSVSLDNLFPKDAVAALEEVLALARSDRQRIIAVERFLISQLKEKNADKLVIRAVQIIYDSKGSVKMKSLHEQLYISQSAFEKRFRKLVGASPKKFAVMSTKHLFVLGFLFMFTGALAQPTLDLPQVSQRAEVKQRIGLTDISIVYYSPYVNGRKIWGDLVPYGKVWRAGANDNTTISFTDDVKVGGEPLAAGTYGLHMIPTAEEWTIIFSKNHTSWGSYFYRQDEDALRIKVKPGTSGFQEWLDYTFTDRAATSCKVTMSWEKMKVSFPVTVDVHTIALRHFREQLRNTAAFGWHGWEEAAHYCIENKINYEEALKWINTSIQVEENYINLVAKAQLLILMGNAREAADTKAKVLALVETANEARINAFGYELIAENDIPTALDVFRINTRKYPDSWNAYDSMAEAYARAGDKKQSLANYKIALSKAPDDQKDRIRKAITGMQ